MIRVAIISHVFVKKSNWERWLLLSEDYNDVEVTLLTPRKWIEGNNSSYTFGHKTDEYADDFESKSFKVQHFKYLNIPKIGWISNDLIKLLKENKYDFVYHIGNHLQVSLLQILIFNRFYKHSKILVFSMRGPQHNIKLNYLRLGSYFNFLLSKLKMHYLKTRSFAIFCHYPDAREMFRREGYKKPVFLQTQVGVNTSRYAPNKKYRSEIREKHNLEGYFVFGSAIRFSESKGVFQILDALPRESSYKFLLIGSGTKESVKSVGDYIKLKGLDNIVVLTGYVNQDEMFKYWSAMDCAIHFPQTVMSWTETFSLSVIQAMASKLCVIGSDSGSLPYQIGYQELIVSEKNISELNKKIVYILNNREFSTYYGKLLRERAILNFDIKHLNCCFYSTIKYMHNNNSAVLLKEHKFDMTVFTCAKSRESIEL